MRRLTIALGALLTCHSPAYAAPPEPCENDRQAAMLRALNNARSEARQCGEQHFDAAPPLRWHCRLEAVARAHSSDMAKHDFISHQSTTGQKLYERIRSQGYAPRAWGENLAAGQQYLVDALNGWLESPQHCRNLMQAKFTQVGGARGETTVSEYRWFWTVVFATPDR
ncbi:MAG: CAP domain-containing protein [Pseudomonadota bacterium]